MQIFIYFAFNFLLGLVTSRGSKVCFHSVCTTEAQNLIIGIRIIMEVLVELRYQLLRTPVVISSVEVKRHLLFRRNFLHSNNLPLPYRQHEAHINPIHLNRFVSTGHSLLPESQWGHIKSQEYLCPSLQLCRLGLTPGSMLYRLKKLTTLLWWRDVHSLRSNPK